MRRIFALILLVCTFFSVYALDANAAAKYSGPGPYANGLGGITINIYASPFTDFAEIPTWGAYAYKSGDCAWFASARARQITGDSRISTIKSGSSWWNGGAGIWGYSAGRSWPIGKALVCYGNHIAVIEKIEGDNVLISEGNGYFSKNDNTGLQWMTKYKIMHRDVANLGEFLGFVYLTQDTEKPVITEARIENQTNYSYDVYIKGTDNQSEVLKFRIGTWNDNMSIDDAKWQNSDFLSSKEIRFTVNISDFGNAQNVTYHTNAFVIDESGNVSVAKRVGDPYITVPAILPTGIALNKSSEVLEVNDQLTLSAVISPSDAENKTINWSSSNTGVATVSNGVVRAVGEGTAVITASAVADPSVKETCTITVVQQAVESCDWAEKSYLPPNVNSDEWDIEVKNHYSQIASTSPGSGWTQSGSGTTQYVFTGEYLRQPYPSPDANDTTLVLVDKYYYHYCSTAGNGWADYWQYGQYTRVADALRPGPMDLSYYRVTATHKDSNNPNVNYYELAWTDKGTAATGYSGTVWCGESSSPSKYWYLNHVYEKRAPVTSYTWTRDSEWLSLDQADSSAESVTYRFRLKGCDAVSYTVTFKVANGSWDDGTTADKTVTLEGIAADTLTLTEAQIPTAGTKPAANYKAGEWGVIPSTDTQITGDTTYTYTYAKKNSISSTVTFKVVNGSWDDGTAENKTVTLNGYEGDTLKLKAADIPAVGNKPATNYNSGSWDTAPSVDTAITGNKTFTYTYKAKSEVTRTVTFKVVNGSWDDGTTADKTVTLNGFEGDTLTLTTAQIPAVGSKPNETYKAGSWDTAPDTTTAITSNKTYTYTYAVDENDNRIKLIVSSEKARPGEEVSVGVSIENNPGIAGIYLTVNYDKSKLVYKGFTNSGLTGWYGNEYVMWDDSHNNMANGEIIKLNFEVLESADEGDGLVTVICDKIGDDKENKFIPVIQTGKIMVHKSLPGDLNNDGEVDLYDVIRLRRFLVKEKDIKVYGNPDLNNDGEVDLFDVIRFRRFLVKEKDVIIY